MRLITLLAAAPLASAFVVPDQQVFAEVGYEETQKATWAFDRVYNSVKNEIKHVGDRVKSELDSASEAFHSTLDAAFESAHDFETSLSEEAFDTQSWINDGLNKIFHGHEGQHGRPPHRDPRHRSRPPHDGPPHDGPPPHDSPRDGPPSKDRPPHHGPPRDRPPHDGPHHGPPHDGPHHGPPRRGGHHRDRHPHHKSNKTVYELIASSKYTTKLAKALEDYPDLIEALNGTKANYTVFAPTNAAFDKIPKDAPKPSKEFLKKVLQYHVSPHFYPAGRVLHTYTIPTLLEGDELAEKPLPQRLAIKLTLRGLTLNYYARIVAIDIFGTNGVIHGLDSFVLPPPRTLKIIDLLPSEFSTFELALTKTGLLEDISKEPVKGGTLFLPNNFAFAKLGPGLNAFLFSPRGLKYLKALLKYHFVPKTTLYSDAIYISTDDDKKEGEKTNTHPGRTLHLDLPTLLEDHSLSVDVGRTGPFIGIFINGFSRVTAHDGVARDGVLQVVSNVLIPPRTAGDGDDNHNTEDAEMTVDEFKARFGGYVE